MKARTKSSAAVSIALAAGITCVPLNALAEEPDERATSEPLPHESTARSTSATEAIIESPYRSVKADQNGRSSTTADNDAEERIYTISDSYPSFETQLQSALSEEATTLLIATSGITDQASVTIPASITRIIGWERSIFGGSGNERVRPLGYHYPLTITFASGSNTDVSSIEFYKANRESDAQGGNAVVAEGATVRFHNCIFYNTPIVEGTAVFENCTFRTGEIVNNGSATYTGSTVEPTNTGTPSENTYTPLAFNVDAQAAFTSLTKGIETHQTIPFTLEGTHASDAQVHASLSDADAGIRVEVQEGNLVLDGNPTQSGTFTVTLTAQTNDPQGRPDQTSKTFTVKVYEQLHVELRGQLLAYTTTTGKPEGPSGSADSTPAARAAVTGMAFTASSSGGGGGFGGGGSHASSSNLELLFTEGSEEALNVLEFKRKYSDADIELSISPSGSGMSAMIVYDHVSVAGSPDTPGTYYVQARVTHDGREVLSNKVPLKIYGTNKTLVERLAELGNASTWDMEPYEIPHVGGTASLPTTLEHLWGSHESGVYGQIGSPDVQFDSERLIIPSGAQVTLSNMKINSSVRVIVEAGAHLTLDDSVVFGPLEVYGTLSTGAPSTTTQSIVLHDGARLENAHIRSHAHYLTDGSSTAPQNPPAPVIVEGAVQFGGDVTLEGDVGAPNTTTHGQPALVVQSGSITLDQDTHLHAIGGGTENIYPSNGGSGIVMQPNTRITGPGSIESQGGKSWLGQAGAGVAGSGTIDVTSLTAHGGESAPEGAVLLGNPGHAGAGVEPGVKVRAQTLDVSGGSGQNAGSSDVTPIDTTPSPNPVIPGSGPGILPGGPSVFPAPLIPSSSGWSKNAEGYWEYLTDQNTKAIGWLSNNGSWFYLNAKGVMQTGWQLIDGSWYYLQDWGGMALGWQRIDNTWYYFGSNGALTVGWQAIDGAWYFFNDAGAMQTGWVLDGGTWYYLNSDGVMQTGWNYIDNNWFYLAENGAMQTGWQHLTNTWYYLTPSGALATTPTEIDGTLHYFAASGAWIRSAS